MNDEMKRLLAMREEQDGQLAEIEAGLRAIGASRDVRMILPQSYFDEMEALTAPVRTISNYVPAGVRG